MKILRAAVGMIFGVLIVRAAAYAAAAPTEVFYGAPVVDGKRDSAYDTMKPLETKNVITGSTTDNPSSARN